MRGVRSCSAHSRTGKPCKYPSIPGGTVCRFHGGGAPQVQQAARVRLAALVDPSIDRLAKLVQEKSPSVALGAVKDVLDRNGLKTPDQLQITALDAEDVAKMTTRELKAMLAGWVDRL